NRGASVDLTLVTSQGLDIEMGTEFDNFSEKASGNYSKLPKIVLNHRKLLKEVMIKNGFQSITTEWWHFNDSDYLQYDVLDYNFSDFKY
ncbi:MAG: peptidase M15, partial [Candidatus Marinimicrobia bacterium]|nr:peptidase M15 [Candidatus Neomarinimicrobiota bacterium]